MAESLQIPEGTSLSIEQLHELVTCSICQETFKDPRSFSCIHTFCLTCIFVWYDAQTSAVELAKCPLCGQPISRPGGGLVDLPKNIYVNQIIGMTSSSAMRTHNLADAEAVSSSDLPTRKLQIFTSATAKHFARKLFIHTRLNKLASAKALMENIDVMERAAVMREFSDEGSSPLFEAVRVGRLDFVEYFLDNCIADIEQRCPWTEENKFTVVVTPLWLAAVCNRLDIVRCLVNHGAEVNSQSSDVQSTVVLSACRHSANDENRIDLIRYLVENGADVNIPNASGFRCLHYACASSAELSRYLIEQGAAVNASAFDGLTALHLAVKSGHLDVVEELVSHGADPKMQTEAGVDALQMAIIGKQDSIFDYLSSLMSTGDVMTAEIFALNGVCCVYRDEVNDAVTNWKLALIHQSDRKDTVKHKLLLYNRCQGIVKNSHLWNKIEQLQIELDDDNSHLAQLQVVFCEEFLGPCHPETIKSLLFSAASYAESSIYQWSVDACLNAMHRCGSRSFVCRPKTFVENLDLPCAILIALLSKEVPVRFCDVACFFTLTIDEFVETLKLPYFQTDWPDMLTLMKLANLLIFLLLDICDENEEHTQLLELVKSLIKLEPRAADGRCLLHVALDPIVDSMLSDLYPDSPNVGVIKTLVECGASVNCADYKGNTPIEYILKCNSLSFDQTKRLVDMFKHHGSFF